MVLIILFMITVTASALLSKVFMTSENRFEQRLVAAASLHQALACWRSQVAGNLAGISGESKDRESMA